MGCACSVEKFYVRARVTEVVYSSNLFELGSESMFVSRIAVLVFALCPNAFRKKKKHRERVTYLPSSSSFCSEQRVPSPESGTAIGPMATKKSYDVSVRQQPLKAAHWPFLVKDLSIDAQVLGGGGEHCGSCVLT